MMFLFYTVLIILLAFCVWAFLFWRSQHERKWVYSALQELSILLGLKDAEMQKLPSPALSGTLFSYPIVVEWSKSSNGHMYRWLFSATLSKNVKERFFIQSDLVEGRLRKVIDLNLCESGDADFDRKCLIFSSSHAAAAKIFDSYFRAKIMKVLDGYFSVAVNGDHATLEVIVDRTTSLAYLASVCEVWAELLNLIESV